jgi:hypothetical protein
MGQFPSHPAQNQYTSRPTVPIVGEQDVDRDARPHFLDGTLNSVASQLQFHEGPVVLSFLSPSCGLCASVKRELQARAEGSRSGTLLRCPATRAGTDGKNGKGRTDGKDRTGRTGGKDGKDGKDKQAKQAAQALYLCLDASDTSRWGPEIVQYGIDRVPCFVVLGAKGSSRGKFRSFGEGRRAVGKTTCVRGESCVLEGLDRLLQRVL